MGISSHELHVEFPQYRELIQELKNNDLKFNEKLQEYTHLDHEIEGLEGILPSVMTNSTA